MKQRRLTPRYELTYQKISFERRTVPLTSVFKGLERFLEERYRDAYSFSGEAPSGYANLCTEGLAFLLREVLQAVLGRQTVHIQAEEDSGVFRIKLSAENGIPLELGQLRTLTLAASQSGIRLSRGEDCLTLAFDTFEESSFFVYAHSEADFCSLLSFMFDEM